uniref:uncharacterized protein LOC120332030 n=1 Tax=Styela clava TaxID=7725 RepID=UPI001939393E|nr:uncharacterized protein LOC120332030 [Styela clava]
MMLARQPFSGFGAAYQRTNAPAFKPLKSAFKDFSFGSSAPGVSLPSGGFFGSIPFGAVTATSNSQPFVGSNSASVQSSPFRQSCSTESTGLFGSNRNPPPPFRSQPTNNAISGIPKPSFAFGAPSNNEPSQQKNPAFGGFQFGGNNEQNAAPAQQSGFNFCESSAALCLEERLINLHQLLMPPRLPQQQDFSLSTLHPIKAMACYSLEPDLTSRNQNNLLKTNQDCLVLVEIIHQAKTHNSNNQLDLLLEVLQPRLAVFLILNRLHLRTLSSEVRQTQTHSIPQLPLLPRGLDGSDKPEEDLKNVNEIITAVISNLFESGQEVKIKPILAPSLTRSLSTKVRQTQIHSIPHLPLSPREVDGSDKPEEDLKNK